MAVGSNLPPRRADARRNIEAIIEGAARCLARDPDASMSDIATEAALGRITIYGHFKTRAELVEVVARRAIANANAILADVDLGGDPAQALARLVTASWEVTTRAGSLVVAAEKVLSADVVRNMHAGELEDRVRRFLTRAQRKRAFRSDLSISWLVAMFHAALHAAAIEVHAKRLESDKVAQIITTTLLGAYQPTPGRGRRARRSSGPT